MPVCSRRRPSRSLALSRVTCGIGEHGAAARHPYCLSDFAQACDLHKLGLTFLTALPVFLPCDAPQLLPSNPARLPAHFVCVSAPAFLHGCLLRAATWHPMLPIPAPLAPPATTRTHAPSATELECSRSPLMPLLLVLVSDITLLVPTLKKSQWRRLWLW